MLYTNKEVVFKYKIAGGSPVHASRPPEQIS